MALTEIYVDPSIGADSGSGTLLDPYGDLEFAIEEEDWDAVNGIRVNIQAGADEVLAAAINVAMADVSSPNKSIAWAPSATAPLVFEGYTAAAGDGGIGGVSGDGATSIFNDTTATGDYITFKNLHLHNTGANRIINAGDRVLVARCELDNASMQAIRLVIGSSFRDCYIHGITGTEGAVYLNNTNCSQSYANFIEFEGTVGDAVRLQTTGILSRCIVIVTDTGAVNGIYCNTSTIGGVEHCAVFSTNNASGSGIQVSGRTFIRNNLVEGFSASGGYGIEFEPGAMATDFAGNGVYDCDTPYLNPDFDFTSVLSPDNETLIASPFANAPGGDFSPIITGNVREGGVPMVIGGGFV